MFGREREASLLQPEKTEAPIVVRFAGRVRDVRFEQFAKVRSLRTRILSDSFTDARAEHPEREEEPSVDTLSGSDKAESFEQFSNAEVPMEERVEAGSKLTVTSLVHPLKASWLICWTVGGMVTVVREEQSLNALARRTDTVDSSRIAMVVKLAALTP